jgi:hypothetical protein
MDTTTLQPTKENWRIERRNNDAVLSLKATSRDWQMLAQYILQQSQKEEVMDMGFTLHNFFEKYKKIEDELEAK